MDQPLNELAALAENISVLAVLSKSRSSPRRPIPYRKYIPAAPQIRTKTQTWIRVCWWEADEAAERKVRATEWVDDTDLERERLRKIIDSANRCTRTFHYWLDLRISNQHLGEVST